MELPAVRLCDKDYIIAESPNSDFSSFTGMRHMVIDVDVLDLRVIFFPWGCRPDIVKKQPGLTNTCALDSLLWLLYVYIRNCENLPESTPNMLRIIVQRMRTCPDSLRRMMVRQATQLPEIPSKYAQMKEHMDLMDTVQTAITVNCWSHPLDWSHIFAGQHTFSYLETLECDCKQTKTSIMRTDSIESSCVTADDIVNDIMSYFDSTIERTVTTPINLGPKKKCCKSDTRASKRRLLCIPDFLFVKYTPPNPNNVPARNTLDLLMKMPLRISIPKEKTDLVNIGTVITNGSHFRSVFAHPTKTTDYVMYDGMKGVALTKQPLLRGYYPSVTIFKVQMPLPRLHISMDEIPGAVWTTGSLLKQMIRTLIFIQTRDSSLHSKDIPMSQASGIVTWVVRNLLTKITPSHFCDLMQINGISDPATARDPVYTLVMNEIWQIMKQETSPMPTKTVNGTPHSVDNLHSSTGSPSPVVDLQSPIDDLSSVFLDMSQEITLSQELFLGLSQNDPFLPVRKEPLFTSPCKRKHSLNVHYQLNPTITSTPISEVKPKVLFPSAEFGNKKIRSSLYELLPLQQSIADGLSSLVRESITKKTKPKEVLFNCMKCVYWNLRRRPGLEEKLKEWEVPKNYDFATDNRRHIFELKKTKNRDHNVSNLQEILRTHTGLSSHEIKTPVLLRTLPGACRQQLHQDFNLDFLHDNPNVFFFLVPLDCATTILVKDTGHLKSIAIPLGKCFLAKGDTIHAGSTSVGVRLSGLFLPKNLDYSGVINFIDDNDYPGEETIKKASP